MAKFDYSKFLDLLLEFKYHEFECDKGNIEKSETKRGIAGNEAEEAFFDEEILVLGKQVSPKTTQSRFGIIGTSLEGRLLFICFTMRDTKIRIISARLANKTEKAIYEK